MTRNRDEMGFTLIEVLTTIAILGILLTIGAMSLRHFWFNRALNSSAEAIVSQFRSTQEKVVSESYPIVYGVRFDVDSSDWWVVKFDPVNPGSGDDTCTTIETHTFQTNVMITAASFTPDAYITDFCKTAVGAPADDVIAFFYPRGNATAGSVTIRQTTIGRTKTVEIAAITGRVTKL